MKKNLFLIALLLNSFIGNINAQWIQTNGPFGGTVNCYSDNGANIILAGTSNGVFLSTDSGSKWISMNNGLTNLNVQSILSVGTNIFAGTYYGGIFLSSNNGANWTAINNGLGSNQNVTSLLANGTTIFAGGDFVGSMFKSTNSGASWTAANNGITLGIVNCMAKSGSTLFAGVDGGIYRSTNNGSSWSLVLNSSGLPFNAVRTLCVSGTNVFAGTDGDGIYISTNNGLSWAALNNGLPNGINIYSMVNDGINIFAGGDSGRIFLSTNNGSSWSSISNNLPNEIISSLHVYGNKLFAGTRFKGGFVSVNNGNSWTAIGFPISDVRQIASYGTKIFASIYGSTSNYEIFSTDNGGNNWSASNNGINIPHYFDKGSYAAIGSNLFVAGCDGMEGGIFLSTDSGANWTQVFSYLGNDCIEGLASNGTTIYAINDNYLNDPNGGLWLSNDTGATWIHPNNNFVPGPYGLLALGVNGNNIFTGYSDLYRSTNNGASWTTISNGWTGYPKAFAFMNNNTFVGGNTGVFKSTNNGGNWIVQNNGLTNTDVVALIVVGSNILAGTTGGVFLSADSGFSWTAVNDGLANLSITSLTADSSYIYAGTENYGVYKRSISSLINSCFAFYTLYPDIIAHNWIALNQSSGIPPLTYSWNWGDGNTSTGMTPSHTYNNSGYYNICLAITDGTGCIANYCDSSTFLYRGNANSTMVNLNVNASVGLNTEVTDKSEYNIYPNPATDYFTLVLEKNIKNAHIEIANITGRIIYSSTVAESQNKDVDTRNFPGGIYFVKVFEGEISYCKKLIVDHN